VGVGVGLSLLTSTVQCFQELWVADSCLQVLEVVDLCLPAWEGVLLVVDLLGRVQHGFMPGNAAGVYVGPSGLMYPVDKSGVVVGVGVMPVLKTGHNVIPRLGAGCAFSTSVPLASTAAANKDNTVELALRPPILMTAGPAISKVAPDSLKKAHENKKTRKDVLKELDDEAICQYCQDTCTPPFMSCPDGHIFCNKCMKTLPQCSKCNHKDLNCRQRGLEKVAMANDWPCNFKCNGCTSVMKMNKLQEHGDICRYRMQKYCPVDGCDVGFTLNKTLFLKQMKDNHQITPTKIDKYDSKSKFVETNYAMRDYAKDESDLQQNIEAVQIFEVNELFVLLMIEESKNELSFRNYIMGETREHESNFSCSRRFVDEQKKYKYAITEPFISISERVELKRKASTIDPDDPTFKIAKN